MLDTLGTTGAIANLSRRVLASVDPLTIELGRQYLGVPEYAALGEQVMETEVLPTSRRIVVAFFTALLGGSEPDVAAVPELEEMGRQRLAMGVPLEPILHVYRIAGRVVWDAIVAATAPGEERVLAEVGARWMDYIDRAASTAAAAYLAASHERLRQVDARRRALVDALLAAADPSEVAAVATAFATTLAPSYRPVILAGDEIALRVDAVVSAAPEGAVCGLRGAGHLLVLIPGPVPDVESLHRAGGECVAAYGSLAEPGPALLTEVVHTQALLSAALAGGGGAGVYGPEDLLVEQLMHANGRVANALHRRVITTINEADRDGILLSTLRTYLATGSVPETARREVVHANTASYRLKRIRQLTGFDPHVPTDAALLVLAVATHKELP